MKAENELRLLKQSKIEQKPKLNNFSTFSQKIIKNTLLDRSEYFKKSENYFKERDSQIGIRKSVKANKNLTEIFEKIVNEKSEKIRERSESFQNTPQKAQDLNILRSSVHNDNLHQDNSSKNQDSTNPI